MAGTKKTMDHAAYQKRLKTRTNDVLIFIMQDAQEAIDAWPHGENAGYYADEIGYAAAELSRRNGRNHCPTCGTDLNAKTNLRQICELAMDVSMYLNAAFEDAVPAQKKLRTLAGLALKELP